MNWQVLRSTQVFALFVGAVVVAVVVFLFATGQFESDDDEDPLALPSEGASELGDAMGGRVELAGAVVALAEAFQLGDLRLLVTERRFGSQVGENRDGVDAQGRFVVIALTARNTGMDPITLGDRIQLLDELGRSYSPLPEASATAALRDPAREDGLTVELQPGLTVDFVLVFDVPEEAKGLRLRVRGGFADVDLDD